MRVSLRASDDGKKIGDHMATNGFYVFDANEGNIMSVADYNSSSVRLNGVTTGVAESTLHNRLYRQTSIMAAAIGQVIADNGVNADDGNLATLIAAIKSVFATKTSGAINVSSGGTGSTTFTSNAILTGNGTSAVVAKATANGAAYATSANGELTFGTLPVAQGGTGQVSLQATRNAMGLGNTTGALPVENGGTGNTSYDSTPTANSTKMVTSGGVKAALDLKQAKNASTTVTIAVGDWSSKTATKSATGVTASNIVSVSPDPAYMDAYRDAGVYCSAQGSGTLTFKCDVVPASSVKVNVLIWNN